MARIGMDFDIRIHKIFLFFQMISDERLDFGGWEKSNFFQCITRLMKII
jgi:hypothetical protein